MPTRIIKSPEQLARLATFLGTMKLPITVDYVQGADRTQSQNRLQFLWASEVSQQLGDRTQNDVQEDWRLDYGVPILCEDNPGFRDTWDSCLRALPRPMQKRVMRELKIKVTSQMKISQMIRYMDTVQRECNLMGLELTDPDPSLMAYQNRYRGPTV